ncbi:MAG: hypothetical protein ACR2NR_11105 [Solirubrobacteraceae bacterium]
MSQPQNALPGFTPPAGSERFRLARLAREASLRVPGVVDSDTGPMGLFITVGEGERLEGVICAATRDGGYEVSLRLVCELVPLLALGEQVKGAVTRSAALAGIALDRVDVHVAALAGEEEQ